LADKEAELNDLKETLRAAKARLKSAGKTKSGTHPKLEAAIKQADAAVKKARAEYNKLKKDTPKIIAKE
jgi:multidrug resistance efflux pump